MKLFKVVEIDMKAERARVRKNEFYSKREKAALRKLYDLFEEGEWQKCADLLNDRTVFRQADGYIETEHVGTAIWDVLQAMAHENFYTQDQMLEDAKDELQDLGYNVWL